MIRYPLGTELLYCFSSVRRLGGTLEGGSVRGPGADLVDGQRTDPGLPVLVPSPSGKSGRRRLGLCTVCSRRAQTRRRSVSDTLNILVG